ncbi:MAG: SusC/RagA family TonB-linked outer membrane protein, partial [Cyclobacteriaceae bacterium]|nr:SusC/RagA family TonB-linked outer membrane protein [Cyclobacteriaceae bacterium]
MKVKRQFGVNVIKPVLYGFMLFTFVLSFITSTAQAQQSEVTGTVTDEDSSPLPGVSVLIKGTTTGSITDSEGVYKVSVENAEAVLVFSFVGYVTREEVVGNRSIIDMPLTPDITALDEIVVVGYGTQKKKDVTGAIASADLEAMNTQPNVSFLEGLQGAIPGLNVGQVNEAGESPALSIRGRTSISGEQDPLIVMDGVIYRGELVDINPSNIKSIDVLKDASASAIYGSQAANGVVMITSKTGTKSRGNPTINYSGMYSFQRPSHELRAEVDQDLFMLKIEHSDILQSRTQASGYLERNPDWSETTNFKTSHEIRQFNAGRSYDWYDHATTDNPYTQNHTISIGNSTDKNNYYAAVGYTDQDGYMIDEYYKRINGRINLFTTVTNWMDIDVQTFLTVSDYGPQTYSTGDRFIEPFATPYDEEGELALRPYGNPINPVIEATADVVDRRVTLNGNITGNVYLPVEGLKYQLRFGNNYITRENNFFGSHGANFTGEGFKEHEYEYTYSLDNILTYSREFNNAHQLDVTLLYGIEERNNRFTRAEGSNFTKDVLGFNRLQAAAADQQRIFSGGWKESSTYSMARVSYRLLNRYLINGTIRRDGFSGFSENNKYGNFPSVALGWIITEESFLGNGPNWLNWLKLRTSYGTTGNRTIGRYQTLAEVDGEFGYVSADDASLFTQWISALSSPDLRWEKTTGINIGLDFRLLGERLNGSIEYYNNNTNDLLYNVDIPGINRFQIFPDNLGEIHNEGLEILLSSVNIQKNGFTWTTDLTFSRNRNKINTLLGFDVNGDGQEDDLTSEGLFIGESLGAIFDYKIDGLYQIEDEIPDGYEFGAYRVVDLNGDDVIDGDDRTIVGNRLPAYRWGLNNVLTYKNWNFRFFINSVQSGKDRYLGEDTMYGFNIFNNETHFNSSF